MPSMSRVAESFQRPPRSATSVRRAPSQADSESSRRPSRSKMTAAMGPAVKAGDQGIEPRPAVLETAILAVGPVPRAETGILRAAAGARRPGTGDSGLSLERDGLRRGGRSAGRGHERDLEGEPDAPAAGERAARGPAELEGERAPAGRDRLLGGGGDRLALARGGGGQLAGGGHLDGDLQAVAQGLLEPGPRDRHDEL